MFAEGVFALEAGNALHPFGPGDAAAIPVKGEYALNAGVEELGEKQAGL